jgi:hypothetical protein
MKLPNDVRTAIDNDEGSQSDTEFEPLPEGYYLATVESIKLSDNVGPSGFHQWIVVWRIKAPKAFAKRTQWDRRSLSPKASFKMRELYDGLGFEYDSDSDELIGESAILEISQAEITSGKRKGEMGNDVERVLDAEDPEYKQLVGK